MPKITKVVLTGGPCSGKTSAKQYIETAFTALGYEVMFVPEVATILIGAGLRRVADSTYEYQRAILKGQLCLESVIERAASTSGTDKDIIIVFDRGVPDGYTFTPYKIWYQLLADVDLDMDELIGRYDIVLHLVSVANGAEENFTMENNPSRLHDVESSRLADALTTEAWAGHPNFHVIGNEKTFDEKMMKMIETLKNAIKQQKE